MNIFLDDIRCPFDVTWVSEIQHINFEIVVRGYDAFKFVVNTNNIHLIKNISFDHDLGLEKTGYDCINYLIECVMELEVKMPNCLFHSMNPVGKNRMIKAYENAIKNCKK